MTRKLVFSSDAAAQLVPGAIGVDSDNYNPYLRLRSGSSYDRMLMGMSHLKVLTASATMDQSQVGTTFVADSTTSIAVTLPAVATMAPGAKVMLVVGQLTSSGGHNLDSNAADTIKGGGLSKSAGDAVTCSAATDAVGDFLELTGDGVATWWITGIRGTWA